MILKSIVAPSLNKSSPRVHLVGIKGVGMAGLAQLLKARGFRVFGSDTHEKFFTDIILKRLHIPVSEHFSPKNIKGVDLVISSNAYLGKRPEHIEIAAARKKGIPILSYPDAIAQLFNNSHGIAVSGSHGKSTVSAMLAVTLEKLGADPSALIGAEVLNWNTTARVSHHSLRTPHYFVLEADEYKRAFLKYKPKIIVITNVDWDHPDIFTSPTRYKAAFVSFIKKLPRNGLVVFWGDDTAVKKVAATRPPTVKALSYGTLANTTQLSNVRVSAQGTSFRVTYKGKGLGIFRIRLIGRQHALNATAVITVCLALGFKPRAIRKALSTFRGTRRRFEILHRNPVIIDDYGHHPAEIAVTIAAARAVFPKRRLLVLFQPHTFSRTKALFPDFLSALGKTDRTFILKTYGSAREQEGATGSPQLAHALRCPYFETHRSAISFLKKILKPHDVLLAMGAGDQWRIAKTLAQYRYVEKRKKR